MSNIETDLDPFAMARQAEDDGELFALIEEFDRREAAANERGIGMDDDERDRRAAFAWEIRDKIAEIRPVTLKGVLAALDFGAAIYDPGYWPDEAIEGLRDIIERETQS